MKPYYETDGIELYLGDSREILPALGVTADLVLADPPYGETSLAWDRWPDGWLDVAAAVSSALWCFGSMRMFLQHGAEFEQAGWKLSQDVIWEKANGTGFAADRFKRVHETATHWYRGDWRDVHHEVPRTLSKGLHHGGDATRRGDPAHTGTIGPVAWVDDGTRMARSVLQVRSMHHNAIHPTEKPVGGLLDLMIRYACPEGGLVVDPFAGSGSTLEAARLAGRRAIGVERHEPYIEKAALRLSQAPLDFSEATL